MKYLPEFQRFAALALVSLSFAACSKTSSHSDAAPVVSSIDQKHLDTEIAAVAAIAATDTTPALPAVPAKPAGALVSTVTLNKASIFGRTFNYSASLQFSSIVSKSISTSMMGLSLGEVPAKFAVMDDKLELLTDGSINFESDVNHPARLLYVFPILSQTDSTLTIRVDGASPVMDTFLFGNDNKVPVRYSFLRSMEYAASDELTLIESTVELTDGSIGEFMESLRPREKTVRADYKVMYNDPALSSEAARYDFLDSGDVFVAKPDKPTVRVKTKTASRWDLNNGQPVRWWVTANIPEDYIETMKNGVEGWNRYSRAMGLPDLIRFEGRLPEGVKVGDPRYNLIVWDTVQDAGAAYESQNADPQTGVQSHSMIYIPYAWVNIGKDFWKKYTPDSQSPGVGLADRMKDILANRSFLDRAVPLHCMDTAEMHLDMASLINPEQYARELLRDVIFHEVGHSFGLAHQFKGSLSYDSEDPSKIFSNSIMDYNLYSVEQAAYAGEHTSDGPLLEYDRQIISVLYNQAKDVKASDPVLAACADDVADSTDKGVDPLCVRYDIGSDVTKEALKSLALITNADAKRGPVPAFSAKIVTDALIALPAANSVKSEDDLTASLKKAQALVAGTAGVYISGGGGGSFGSLGSSAVKALKSFQAGVLPDGYVENDMRDRALQSFEAAVEMNAFPDLVKNAMLAVKPAVLQYVSTTAYYAGLSADAQQALLTKLSPVLDKVLFTDVQTSILSKLHQNFIKGVVNTPTAPMAFVKRNGETIDTELEVMTKLAKLAGEKMGNVNRPLSERAAALTALKSYHVSENYAPIAENMVTSLKAEIARSTDALRREDIRDLLANFAKKDPLAAAN